MTGRDQQRTAQGFATPASGADTPTVVPPAASEPPRIPGYVVEGPLANGGMGMVWAARHETLQRRVAIKLMRQDLARDPAYVERFLREARAAARVCHPGVVAVHDAAFVDGQLYLAMELVEGGDLRGRIANGPLAEPIALEVMIRAAEAVSAIHRAGLVHRDLKPENVLLAADGQPKVADLGLARETGGDDRMTTTGEALGTPAYMAPEQANGVVDLDARCDVYGLGATLYALLTGRPPFVGATAWATVHLVISAPPPDPRAIVPAISARTAAAVMKALAKDRAQRQQSAEEFAAELRAAAEGGGAVAVVAEKVAGTISAGGKTAIAAASTGWRRWRSWSLQRRLITGYVAVVLLIILTAASIAIFSGPGRPPHRSDPPPRDKSAAAEPAPAPAAAAEPADEEPAKPSGTRAEIKETGANMKSAFKDLGAAFRGALAEEVNGTVPDLDRAALAALDARGLTKRSHVASAEESLIEGTLGDGDSCKVTIERAGHDRVRLTAKVGVMGDGAKQRAILDEIERR